MKAILFTLAAAFSALAVQAQPQERFFVYEEQIGGPYTQGWSAVVLGPVSDDRIDTYVIGAGKSGEFFGVLAVDCDTPRFSQWRALGGSLPADRVPPQAVQAIRNLVCDRP